MSLIAVAVALLLGGQDSSARPAVCDQDDQSVACAVAEQARLEARYGAPSIETESATGAQVFRSFFYDGYGRDILLVSFEMRPNMPPMVVVRGNAEERVEAPGAASTWDRVESEGIFADRVLMPMAAKSGDDEVLICMHGWGVVVEMANAADDSGYRPAVRRKAQNTCDHDGMAGRFGFLLADQAVLSVEACEQLDADKHRNAVARLRACLFLQGNTLAAASLMNEKGEPPGRDYAGTPTRQEWSDWLSTNSTSRIDWAGAVYQETSIYRNGQSQPARLSQRMVELTETMPDLAIYQSRVGARDDRNGWIEGEISYRVSSDGDPERLIVAEYRQEWSRGGGFGWRMDNWVVQPFRPLETPE